MTLPVLDWKYKAVIYGVILIGAFAGGRYSVSAPEIKTEIAEQKKEETITDKKEDVKTHTETKIVEVKTPDGVDTKTTTVAEVKDVLEDTKRNDKVQDDTQIKQDIIPPKTNTLNLSVLAATTTGQFGTPIYGASVTKEIIGPITAGAFFLTNGTVGVSIGMSF